MASLLEVPFGDVLVSLVGGVVFISEVVDSGVVVAEVSAI